MELLPYMGFGFSFRLTGCKSVCERNKLLFEFSTLFLKQFFHNLIHFYGWSVISEKMDSLMFQSILKLNSVWRRLCELSLSAPETCRKVIVFSKEINLQSDRRRKIFFMHSPTCKTYDCLWTEIVKSAKSYHENRFINRKSKVQFFFPGKKNLCQQWKSRIYNRILLSLHSC